MGLAIKLSYAVLAITVIGVLWWCLASGNRQRRRTKAEAWARAQAARTAVESVQAAALTRAREQVGPTVPEQRRAKHYDHDEHPLTVAMLIEQAVQSGDALRLRWTPEHVEPATGLVRPYAQDETPTAILPAIRDFTAAHESSRAGKATLDD